MVSERVIISALSVMSALSALSALSTLSALLAVLVILAIQLFAIQQCYIASTELCELVSNY